ncbi:hypothetical protein L873DRAFT_1820302 [Choiromyces venosus 120613-1]|uniref:Uncharacterized protein n=1 Tax=Choiromyces venosus 120613-1 TaxID=1336337 RepID=A0A3N4IYE8_9PEZI|nr:hypothetical protein L873DRAFT_1820302 [Choiromyces venosus 120613-1]
MPPPDLTSHNEPSPTSQPQNNPPHHTAPKQPEQQPSVFYGGQRYPQGQRKTNRPQSKIFREKTKPKNSKGPRAKTKNQPIAKGLEVKKTQRLRPKSHSRQKTKPTPGRKVGKPKNPSNLETRVCPNGRSNEQTRRGKAKRQVPYDQLYPGQQNERIPIKEA